MRMGTFPLNLDWEEALHQAASFLKSEFEAGIYDPYNDMVLVPFNVKFGTVLLNKLIAEMLDRHEQRIVHPIVVGWHHQHFAIGDHVLYDTQDYVIESIVPEPKYVGTEPNPPSAFIDRDGSVNNRKAYEAEQLAHSPSVDLDSLAQEVLSPLSPEQIHAQSHVHEPLSTEDFLMIQIQKGVEEKTNTASHKITIKSLDDPEAPALTLNSVGDIMKLSLSYAITVHKAQGLQAPRVYFFLHSSHAPMHFRELIYTACSRPKEYLTVICDPKTLERGMKLQRIEGTTLEEKKEYFRKALAEVATNTSPL